MKRLLHKLPRMWIDIVELVQSQGRHNFLWLVRHNLQIRASRNNELDQTGSLPAWIYGVIFCRRSAVTHSTTIRSYSGEWSTCTAMEDSTADAEDQYHTLHAQWILCRIQTSIGNIPSAIWCNCTSNEQSINVVSCPDHTSRGKRSGEPSRISRALERNW